MIDWLSQPFFEVLTIWSICTSAYDNLDNGIALVVVVVVTVLFTYYQENRSRKIMASFAKMTPPLAQVETTSNSLPC